MKVVIVLLATAVAFAYGASILTLKTLSGEVRALHKETLNTEKFDSIFVKDLKKNKTDSCEAEFFCQAEKVLSEVKLSEEGDNKRVDKLARYLKVYNNGLQKNCTVPTKGDEIILRSFLDDLVKCTQKTMTRRSQPF